MANITEITEESNFQIEIIETGSRQIEVISDDSKIIEVIEASFVDSRLQGSVTSSQNSISITGSNTTFTTDLIVGDTVRITSGSTSQVFKVASISSDLLLTLGGIWTGNTYTGSFISKQVVAGSIDDGDTLVTFETNTVAIESPSEGNTTVDITTNPPTTVETTVSTTTVEVIEPSLVILSQSADPRNLFLNITASGDVSASGKITALSASFSHIAGNSPITVQDNIIFESNITASKNLKVVNELESNKIIIDGGVFTSESLASAVAGRSISLTDDTSINSLTVSNTLFTNIISSSIISFNADGVSNIITVNSGGNVPITVDSQGVIIFDEFTYTPNPIQGGLIFSASEFYLGL